MAIAPVMPVSSISSFFASNFVCLRPLTMTERIGFWIDLDDAYLRLANDYIESVWW